MNSLMLFMLASDLSKPQRRDLVERLFPLAIPAAGGQRFAFAAITADQQVRRDAQAERRLVEEMVRALVKAEQVSKPEDLAQFPSLQAAFNRLPAAAQAQLFTPSADKSDGDRRTATADRTTLRGTPART